MGKFKDTKAGGLKGKDRCPSCGYVNLRNRNAIVWKHCQLCGEPMDKEATG